MKIFVDEHIPLMTVRTLRMLDHDVRAIRGTPDEGMPDDALWEMAQREERLLITTDKEFTHYRMVPHHGVLIIRLRRHTATTTEPIQDPPTHHASPGAVFRHGMARFTGGHARCRTEHLACSGEPLSRTKASS